MSDIKTLNAQYQAAGRELKLALQAGDSQRVLAAYAKRDALVRQMEELSHWEEEDLRKGMTEACRIR